MSSQSLHYIGAIDQGTTGTRFMVFDRAGRPVAAAYQEHRQRYPHAGWVEHDPEEIWANTLDVMSRALAESGIAPDALAAIGVTNQRETVVVWDSSTGRPAHPALVWQDRRTADRCRQLTQDGWNEFVRARTGLPIDPYFSATKLEWLLDNVPGLRRRADAGKVLAGTIDSWLLWKLTGRHVTDPTNASRTMLFNLHTMAWDPDLLGVFHVPRSILPEIRSSAEVYGVFDTSRIPNLGKAHIPIASCLGDQQAALFGQTGFSDGDMKVTVGTGSFLLRHTGETPVLSRHGLLTTVACSLPAASPTYALEGSVFITGAAVQWLRDGLGLIAHASETQAIAASVPDHDGVYFVPAFAGLGAPYWEPNARGVILGITARTTKAHVVRAALEAMCYQARDVIEAMAADTETSAAEFSLLRVDGGAVANDFLCQFQADILGTSVVRPATGETTAVGAAFAAGLATGFWSGTDELRRLWHKERVFEPAMDRTVRETLYAGWRRATSTAMTWARDSVP